METEEAGTSSDEQLDVESRSLDFVLGGKVAEFFDAVWQQSCAVFSQSSWRESSEQDVDLNPWNWEALHENPVQTLVQHGFFVLTNLMEQTHSNLPNGVPTEEFKPLLFRDQQLISEDERALYSYATSTDDSSINLWAAFLNGCSIVMNHVDVQSPWIAALCTDLQRSVPHAYANAYITPAQSQTVPPHADDRDVFIVQVYGRKQWTVYSTIPIPLPYPHEQVGKSDELPVPEAVLKGPVLIQRVLSPGDVLYMPRGYVHEARSCDDSCSFHVTVAIATHDWTMAGLLTAATQPILSRHIDLRRAIHRNVGRRGRLEIDSQVTSALQHQIDQAMQLLRHEFTIDSIDSVLCRKYQSHNQRTAVMRETLYLPPDQISNASATSPVGRAAAARVSLSTWLRAATVEEKASIKHQQPTPNQNTTAAHTVASNRPQVGLHVRGEIYDDVIGMIQYLKHDPNRCCELRLLPDALAKDRKGIDSEVRKDECLCDLTLVSMGRRCVELGALAIENPRG